MSSASSSATIAPWSQAEINLAAQLWSREGFTGKQIAEALNKRFGTGRTETVVLRLAARLRNQFPLRGPGHSALSRVFERLEARKDFDIRPTAGKPQADAARSFCARVPLPGRYERHHAPFLRCTDRAATILLPAS